MNAPTTTVTEAKIQESSSPEWTRACTLALAATALVCALVFFNGLGSFPLLNPDEALYAEPAREMLKNGDWLTTHLNYIVRYTKPPLVIWAQAISFILFGVNEFAARSFGAACGVILVIATQAFVTRYVSLRTGLVAAFSLATAPLFFGTARDSITDIPLSLFLAGAFMTFFAAFHEKNNRLLATIGYVLIALAVMTKGPVAIVLPVAILGAFYLTTGRLKQAWQRFFPLVGAVIVAVLALPWFVAEIITTKGEYFQEFFIRENFQRFTAEVDSHKAPVWYHVAAVMGGFFPYSLFLPQALVDAFSEILKKLKEPFYSCKSLAERLRIIPGALSKLDLIESIQYFSVLWLVITVAFFSASVSKLLPYTLPAFPAAAILFAIEVEKAIARPKRLRLLIPIAIIAAIFVAAPMALPLIISKVRHIPADAVSLLQTATTAAAAGMVSALVAVCLNRKKTAEAILISTQLAIAAFVAPPLTVSLSKLWEGPIPEMARTVGKLKEPAFVFDMRKPSVPFYADRQMSQAWTWAQLTSELGRLKRAYIITRARNKETFLEMLGFTVLQEEGQYLLLRFDNPDDLKEPYTPSPGIYRMQR